MMLFQQFTGINAIMFYAETIFEQAHFKVSVWWNSLMKSLRATVNAHCNVLYCLPQSSDVATVIVAATQVFFTAVAAVIMDKAGRKVLLILSGRRIFCGIIHLHHCFWGEKINYLLFWFPHKVSPCVLVKQCLECISSWLWWSTITPHWRVYWQTPRVLWRDSPRQTWPGWLWEAWAFSLQVSRNVFHWNLP